MFACCNVGCWILSMRILGMSMRSLPEAQASLPSRQCFCVNAAPGHVFSLQPPQHPQHRSQEPLCLHADHSTFSQSLFLQTQAHASFPQHRPHKLQQLASVKGMLWFLPVLLHLNSHSYPWAWSSDSIQKATLPRPSSQFDPLEPHWRGPVY